MGEISTHVLDAVNGGGMSGVAVRLRSDDGTLAGSGVTATDGRISCLAKDVEAGMYTLEFELPDSGQAIRSVSVRLSVVAGERYHIPLLASNCAATVYLGST